LREIPSQNKERMLCISPGKRGIKKRKPPFGNVSGGGMPVVEGVGRGGRFGKKE